jgi:hypothetical protein
MGLRTMSDWAATLEHVAKVAAIVLGGIWAYWRFGWTRERSTKLTIDLSHSTYPYGPGRYLVEFDVVLNNRGNTLITAKHNRCPAYNDSAEALQYGGDLLLRHIPSDLQQFQEAAWFSKV